MSIFAKIPPYIPLKSNQSQFW